MLIENEGGGAVGDDETYLGVESVKDTLAFVDAVKNNESGDGHNQSHSAGGQHDQRQLSSYC